MNFSTLSWLALWLPSGLAASSFPTPVSQQNSLRGVEAFPLWILWVSRMCWHVVQWNLGKKKTHQTSAGGATLKTRDFILSDSVNCSAGTLICHRSGNVNPHINRLFCIQNPFSVRSVPRAHGWREEVLSYCLMASKGQQACSSFWGSVNWCPSGKLCLNHCLQLRRDKG